MENIREKVRRFLTEFKSPKEKDIQDFLSYIALGNPSLDRDSFRNSVLKSIEQRDILIDYEKEIFSLSRDLPIFTKLEIAFNEAKEGHDNLEDVEDELNNIKKILTSFKTSAKSDESAGKKPAGDSKIEVKPQVEHAEVPKPAELKPAEAPNIEVKPQVEHAEVPKPAESKPAEVPKIEVKPQVGHAEVPKPAESKPAEVPNIEVKPQVGHAEVPKPAESKPAEAPKIEVKPQVENAEVPKPAESKPAEAPKIEVKPQVEHAEVPKPAESKPAEAPKIEVKPQVEHAEVPKPAESKPAEAPKIEVKPQVEHAEVPKPAESKPAEAPKIEVKPQVEHAEVPKPAESKPAEAPKIEVKPQVEHAEVPKPAESKPAEAPKIEVKPQVEHAEVPKPAESKPAEVPKIEVKPQVEHAEVPKPAESKPAEVPKIEVKPQVEHAEVAKPAPILQEEMAGSELEELPEGIEEEIASLEEVLGEESKPESKEDVKISEPKKVEEVKISKPKKVEENKISVPKKIEEIKVSELVSSTGKPESADAIMRRLNMDNTKTILKDQMTPEKQAVFELLEEKLMSDVETRIKKLKELQTKVLEEEEKPKSFANKLTKFFTKEMEAIDAYDPSLHGPLVTFEGLEGFNEIERYWVNEPYCFVVILFDPENNIFLYFAAEPALSEFEELFLKEIKDRLKDVLLVETVQREDDKKKILTAKVIQLVKDYALDISPLTLEKVLYYSRRDFIYFGKIDPLMHDNRIEDVSSNGFDIPIYLYHKKYTNIPTNIYYKENDLNSYVIRLAQRCGKHISVAEPMIDATMPDGSRIQMTLGTEVTSRGSTFTIRKFSEVPITPVDLINWNTFSAEEMAYLWTCIENNKSLIFSGGTASGKTSSLNAVSLFIPPQAKVITLEDTRELKLPHPNWIPGVTRASFTPDGRGGIDMYELLRAASPSAP